METKEKQIIVFITDGSIEYRNLLRTGFREAGINAKIISFNCEDRLMHYLTKLSIKPDIILLSFDLENEKAKQCIKNIRANKQFAGVPVIIFSACSYLQDIHDAFNAGANLFIPKPVFVPNKRKILQTIFSPAYKRTIHRPNQKRFVLRSADDEKLNWSSC